jgi:hypothetical protein
MSKIKQVKWNGAKEDPDSIVQYGVTFNKGEWTKLPDDIDPKYVDKFHRSAAFEVKGEDNAPLAPPADTMPGTGTPQRAAVTTFKPVAVIGSNGKPAGWKIEGRNAVTGANVPGPTDEYADEASAQVVCDGLNQVAP